jgi:hypothetical protein
VRAIFRAPLLHFFLIGGVLFALDHAIDSEDARKVGRDSTVSAGASAGVLDEEGLFVEEARARGYHRSDPLVRRRLVRNMRFVHGETERSDEVLFEEALALGMDRSDPVVRRRLAQRIGLGIESVARREVPGSEELEAYLDRHAERFALPATIELSHVFLSRDRRGDAVEPDARRVLEHLISDGIEPEAAIALGDPILLQAHQPPRSEAELARTFGAAFTREVASASSGSWIGPVPSSYGLHLVWVHERRSARAPDLDAVRSAVLESLQADRAAAAVREAVQTLRSGGRV